MAGDDPMWWPTLVRQTFEQLGKAEEKITELRLILIGILGSQILLVLVAFFIFLTMCCQRRPSHGSYTGGSRADSRMNSYQVQTVGGASMGGKNSNRKLSSATNNAIIMESPDDAILTRPSSAAALSVHKDSNGTANLDNGSAPVEFTLSSNNTGGSLMRRAAPHRNISTPSRLGSMHYYHTNLGDNPTNQITSKMGRRTRASTVTAPKTLIMAHVEEDGISNNNSVGHIFDDMK